MATPPDPQLKRATGGQSATQGPLSLLLIEDDRADTLLVEELIADSAADIRLIWAESIAEAERALDNSRPDCILLDLNLPDATGFDALDRIAGRDPTIPVVVLTGQVDEHFGVSAVGSGAQDYLVKGRVDPETLRRSLLYAIERKRAEITAVHLQTQPAAGPRERPARTRTPALPTASPRPRCRDRGEIPTQPRERPPGRGLLRCCPNTRRTVHLVIGDVAGHGPDEAALGAALRIGWRVLTLAGFGGTERMRRLEELLFAERAATNVFATVLSLTLHPDSSGVTAIRAGHPGMLVHGSDSADWLEPPGGLLSGCAVTGRNTNSSWLPAQACCC